MPAPTISALPVTPSRNAPSTFSTRMDAFLAAFPTFRTDANALAAYLDNLALATGPGLFGNGTVASPAVSFASDPDTGLYRIGADQLGFTEGGVDRGRLYGRRNILGTVSQTAGVPTGTLMQYDTNANGEFWRYAGGMQICTLKVDVANISTATGSVFMSSATTTWTFPAVFIAAPVISGVGGSTNRWLGGTSVSGTAASVRAMSSVTVAGASTIELTAIGRWF